MARQVGKIKITGTLDGVCYYKMEVNYYVRMNPSTAKSIAKNPAYAALRARMAEMGSCSHSIKLIRFAFRSLMGVSDRRAHSLLLKTMIKIKNMDTINVPGKRTIS